MLTFINYNNSSRNSIAIRKVVIFDFQLDKGLFTLFSSEVSCEDLL
jgi:hypothetical protein